MIHDIHLINYLDYLLSLVNISGMLTLLRALVCSCIIGWGIRARSKRKRKGGTAVAARRQVGGSIFGGKLGGTTDMLLRIDLCYNSNLC